jgi:hypothetical protein
MAQGEEEEQRGHLNSSCRTDWAYKAHGPPASAGSAGSSPVVSQLTRRCGCPAGMKGCYQ